MRSISDFGKCLAPKAESLLVKPGMISFFLLNMPLIPALATARADMLNFSARSANASSPARLAKPVAVGPGQRQLTEMLLSFNS